MHCLTENNSVVFNKKTLKMQNNQLTVSTHIKQFSHKPRPGFPAWLTAGAEQRLKLCQSVSGR